MANITGEFYLAVKRKSKSYLSAGLSARLSTRTPALKPGEVALKIIVEVPSAMFERPQLQARLKVPESQVSKPVIDAEVLDNIQEVLQQQLGLDISLSVVENKGA